MGDTKFRLYTLITGTGFLVIIIIWLVVSLRLRDGIEGQSRFTRESYREYVEGLIEAAGPDDDLAFQDSLIRQEARLLERERGFLRKVLIVLVFSIGGTVVVMGLQAFIGYRSVLLPIRALEAEERARVMMNSMPISCSLWNRKGRLLYSNNMLLRLFDLSSRFETLDEFFSLCPEFQDNGRRTRDIAMDNVQAALAGGSPRVEWLFRAGDETVPLETIFVPIPWHNDTRIAIYCRDLRELKAREAAAQEVEDRLRVMLDTMSFAAFFFNAEGNPVDCNRRAQVLYGCRDKDHFLRNFFDFSPEYQSDGSRSLEKAKKYICQAFKTGEQVFLWEHRKADGTPLPAEITLIRVDWKDGSRLVAYARDLSKVFEAEDNLKRILSVVEGSPNITLFISADGDIEYMNPAISYVTGLTREELLQDGLERAFSPGDFQRLGTEYLAAALNNNRVVNFEAGVFAKDGGLRRFSFSAFAVGLHEGKTGVGLLGRDITDLKQIQQDLTAAKEQAERALVREVQYNKAKSDFLSRVSHELRTPISAIAGMTGIARKTGGEREQSRCFDQIEEAAKHLLDMVDDILDLTGFDTGTFSWTPKPFSFSKTIRPVVELIRIKAAAKEQLFSVEIAEDIPDTLISDERRLKQVLNKLLANAVKFTPNRGIVGLSARLIENLDDGCLIRFEVSDTGIGINTEVRERLWDVFEQGDNSITRSYGGMGLGLPLTRRIVELMNGSIQVQSTPGKGSRFICDLRFGRGEPVELSSDESIDLSGRRMLVVDDVGVNRKIIFALLEDSGVVIDEAENGVEAVGMFIKNHYDLLLLDLHMPIMDGFEAAEKIRASGLPHAQTTPIIAISADSGADLPEKCRKAGMNDCLSKPVDMALLFAKIEQWLPAKK
ncbi:MAG: response regulator [Treponema sp.]|jgi:PAS domain S-box-containing protein|nr:response regulator [Treponema sp.]